QAKLLDFVVAGEDLPLIPVAVTVGIGGKVILCPGGRSPELELAGVTQDGGTIIGFHDHRQPEAPRGRRRLRKGKVTDISKGGADQDPRQNAARSIRRTGAARRNFRFAHKIITRITIYLPLLRMSRLFSASLTE